MVRDAVPTKTDPLVVNLRCDDTSLWSCSNNILLGCTLPQWLALLRRNYSAIDLRPCFLFRVFFITLMSVLNSVFAIIDYVLYNRQIIRTKIAPRPLFILGQPRSGTTLLHNLLALDPQFATPDIFQVGFSSSFISMRFLLSTPVLHGVLSATRPMDNMTQNWQCESFILFVQFTFTSSLDAKTRP